MAVAALPFLCKPFSPLHPLLLALDHAAQHNYQKVFFSQHVNSRIRRPRVASHQRLFCLQMLDHENGAPMSAECPTDSDSEKYQQSPKQVLVQAMEDDEEEDDNTLDLTIPFESEVESRLHVPEVEEEEEEEDIPVTSYFKDNQKLGLKEEDIREIPWEIIKKFWYNPAFCKFRLSLSVANLTMALPSFIGRVVPLISKLSQISLKGVSLRVLAPLLFGGGIVFKTALSNLGIILPRLLMSVATIWVLWGMSFVIQDALARMKEYAYFDNKVTNLVVLTVELTFSVMAFAAVLSSIGVNITAFLLPAFLAVGLAGKDIWKNYFAGCFLLAAQPFRPGNTVAIKSDLGLSMLSGADQQFRSGWFEGVCETINLRYTVLRNGHYRLMVPNSTFVKDDFIVIDPLPQAIKSPAKKRVVRSKKKGKLEKESSDAADQSDSQVLLMQIPAEHAAADIENMVS